MIRSQLSNRESSSIAEALTRARPGGTSSRADEWRTPPVRSDPKLETNDLVMAMPRPTTYLPVRNRKGTSARRRGSRERRIDAGEDAQDLESPVGRPTARTLAQKFSPLKLISKGTRS